MPSRKKHCRNSTTSRRQFSGTGDDAPSGQRRLFTKFVEDEAPTLSTVSQVYRFIEGMESFPSKAELLDKIEDRRSCGMKRIPEILGFLNSIRDVDQILIRMLRLLLDKELFKPMYLPKRNKVLMAIYIVPSLMETLAAKDAASLLSKESAGYLCLFLQEISKAFMEPRKSEFVMTMAKALRSRGDVDAATLCAVLLVDEQDALQASSVDKQSGTGKTSVCWVTDNVPPGGRHDNDERNFRDIQILPTTDELCCKAKSWLPLSSGDNAIIHDPATRLLDKHFRLLREDAIATIKENIAEQKRAWKNARIIDLDFARYGNSKSSKSFTFLVQLDSRPGGNPNWERSRVLMQGSVVAFCTDVTPKLMGKVSLRNHESGGRWLNDPLGPVLGVTFEPHTQDFQRALSDVLENLPRAEQFSEGNKKNKKASKMFQMLKKYDMVEASSSFFTYQPILTSLQSKVSLPFLEEICNPIALSTAQTPGYLPDTLKMPSVKSFNGYRCSLSSWSSDDVVKNTSLDPSQADALHHAFTSRVSLIQGPPGTGKTFIGALIARMIRENTDQSILCICYTNHALDQFLEHMLDAGERRIVRLGGRSKSQKLTGYGLRELVRNKAKRTDFSTIKRIDAQLHARREEIEKITDTLKTKIGWSTPHGGIRQLLEDEYPDEFECFPDLTEDADGFKTTGKKGKAFKKDELWTTWSKGETFPSFLREKISAFCPAIFEEFWSMPYSLRLERIDEWKNRIFEEPINELKYALSEYNTLVHERDSLRQTEDLQILKDARVIGATTTGAANFKDLLASKAAGVIIIEEAGEVLEGHVLSALQADSTKHLIMIGDHKQLRPKVENYTLSTVSGHGYDLDCSLFERLVLSNLPSATLNVQHRMRPEISQFIRTQTYPKLQDHSSVNDFPNVKGVTENVVFVDHKILEDGAGSNEDDAHLAKTKSNTYEAEVCVEIVRFFLLQGYAPSRIAILTPYLGQLMRILSLVRSRLREAIACVSEQDQRDLEDIGEESEGLRDDVSAKSVRCSTVDNFQGEEADLVVISLVRSNPHGNVGFLKEAQRVNVLMSRAKHGMFIIGNSSVLRGSKAAKKVWDPILDSMESAGRLLPGLPTYCFLHPDDEPVLLSRMEDWRLYRPNGGCRRQCNFRMECGHECYSSCHPNDRDHKLLQRNCCKPCKRVPPGCSFGHLCTKLCKAECGPCNVKVGSVRLNCGHSMDNVLCHQVEKEVETLTKLCRYQVTHSFSSCGHTAKTTCGNANRPSPVCPMKCGKPVELCGHPCILQCGSCGSEHFCGQKCDRILFCGHECGQKCHGNSDCSPCSQRCAVICSHSRCPKKCNEPCASCVEECEWECEHQGRCEVVCGAPCTRLPCNKRCEKKLECGHICPSVCGEPCPPQKYCKECGDDWVKSHVLDMIEMKDYENHDVDEDPIIVLPCLHFYASSTMDGLLGMSELYETCKRTGAFIGLKNFMDANVNEKPAVCPDCRAVIHSVRRYGRFLNLKGLRSLERKHIFFVKNKLKSLQRICEEGKNYNESKFLEKLEELETDIMKSPMRKVKDACSSSASAHSMEIPSPPVMPLLGTLELKGRVYSDQIGRYLKKDKFRSNANDEADDGFLNCFDKAKETYRRGIAIADGSESIRSGANLRLSFASLLCRASRSDRIPRDKYKEEVITMLDWIIAHEGVLGNEFALKAQQIKQQVENDDIVEVVKAMSMTSGYNYGGSWSSHWYECPNGHPYFIGECGGAMEEAKCIECGAPVGGRSHTLAARNRSASALISQAQAALPL